MHDFDGGEGESLRRRFRIGHPTYAGAFRLQAVARRRTGASAPAARPSLRLRRKDGRSGETPP